MLEEPVETPAPRSEQENEERAAAGVEPAKWEYIGTFETAASGALPLQVTSAGTQSQGIPADDDNSFAVGFPDTGRIYRVSRTVLDRETLEELYEAQGAHLPTETEIAVGEGEATFDQKAWSDGVDNRTPRGIWEHGVGYWPYRTIAEVVQNGADADSFTVGHCTAALVGSTSQRHILTAAHCLWDSAGNYLDPDYIPRKDGCEASIVGWPINNCDRSPYGKWDGAVWFMSTYFVNNCVAPGAYDANFQNCMKRDIVVQQVFPESGATFPGAMGFGSYSNSALQSTSTYHRGYPVCTGPNAPASPCRQATLHGQPWPCNIHSFDGNVIHHGCDNSGGMSGNNMYLYSFGSVFVFAVDVAGTILGVPSIFEAPNHARRIDNQFYGWMLDFMNL